MKRLDDMTTEEKFQEVAAWGVAWFVLACAGIVVGGALWFGFLWLTVTMLRWIGVPI